MRLKYITNALLKDSFRTFEAIFWTIVFPVLFYMFFTALFGGMNDANREISFNVGVVYEKPLVMTSKTIFDEVFKNLDNKNKGPYKITYYNTKDEAISKMKDKDIDIFILFPEKFSMLNTKMIMKNIKIPDLEVYYSSRYDADFAKNIFKGVIDSINLEINKKIKHVAEVKFENAELTKIKTSQIGYKEFLFPSVILMAIMAISFFNIPMILGYNLQQGINKRLFTTPIRANEYFFAIIISQIISLIMSFVLLYIAGYFMKVSSKILSIEFFGYILMATVVMMSVGLVIVSFFKKMSTMNVVAQIGYQLCMFLGGLFFEVKELPWILKWFVIINPVTYMAEGMRNIIFEEPLTFLHFGVPMAWLIGSLIIFSMNYKKVMGYE